VRNLVVEGIVGGKWKDFVLKLNLRRLRAVATGASYYEMYLRKAVVIRTLS
jgi:hypothetical protein